MQTLKSVPPGTLCRDRKHGKTLLRLDEFAVDWVTGESRCLTSPEGWQGNIEVEVIAVLETHNTFGHLGGV